MFSPVDISQNYFENNCAASYFCGNKDIFLMNRKSKTTALIRNKKYKSYIIIINVTSDQFNASLLNKSITSFQKVNK